MSDPGPSNAEEEEQLVYGASAGPSTFRYEPETARGSGWDAQGSEDDDDDLEFEEVGGAADLADAPKPRQHTPADDHHDAVTESSPKRSEALEIVLEKAHRPELKDKKSKQK